MFDFSRRRFFASLAALPLAAVFVRPAKAATTHTVHIQGFAFQPSKLSIAKGDTVKFKNNDNAAHTADDRGKTWKTGKIRGSQSKDVTFDSAGSFDYFCRYHPAMKGKVTVS